VAAPVLSAYVPNPRISLVRACSPVGRADSPSGRHDLGAARRRDRCPVRWLMFIAPLQIAVLDNPAKKSLVPMPNGRFGQRCGKPEQKGRPLPRCSFDGVPVDH
jgi:hypothetical protein